MQNPSSMSFDTLLRHARHDGRSAIAELLESYRHYLRLLARMQLHTNLQVRVSPSDVVQESMLAAEKAFAQFQGETESELVAWLRRVLASRLADAARFHSALRRDVNSELRLDEAVDQSSMALHSLFPEVQDSPSQIVSKREEAVLLSEALQRLPADYAEVIVQRHLESKPFADISRSMNRTVPSVKAIWARAMASLRQQLGGDPS